MANASERATQVSGNLTPAVAAAHKDSSDALVVRGRKNGTQVGNHGKWESWHLVRLAADENIQKTAIAGDLVRDLLESASGSSMTS